MRLFGKLAAMFETPPAAPPGHDTSEVALAALMVRLAKADDHFSDEERTAIEATLEARFGDGPALLAAGESAERDALDSQQFTRALKAAHAHEDRGELLEDLWRVVLADGSRDAHENALMRQLGALLHISDREIAEARRRVASAGA